MVSTIIGIDCATQDAKTGLARASLDDRTWTLTHAFTAGRGVSVLDTLTSWIASADSAVLAFDAPLGWPASLPLALSTHRAGETPQFGPAKLFRRETDEFVRREFNKSPLEVGADRIARTAYSALALLAGLRQITKRQIPLAWSVPASRDTVAIEVYPAATLRSYGVSLAGYRKREGKALRTRLLGFVGEHLQLACDADAEEIGVDGLDAAVCVVAARDFLDGNAAPPVDRELAAREGWIWVRQRPSL